MLELVGEAYKEKEIRAEMKGNIHYLWDCSFIVRSSLTLLCLAGKDFKIFESHKDAICEILSTRHTAERALEGDDIFTFSTATCISNFLCC